MRSFAFDDWLRPALRATAIALAFFVAAYLFTLLLRALAKRAGASVEPHSPLAVSIRPLRMLIVLLGLYYAASEVAAGGRAEKFIDGSLFLASVLVGIVAISRLTTFVLSTYFLRVPADDRIEREYIPLARKVSLIVISTVGLLIAFHHFGIEVTAVVTTLGVGGLAVGLAAKETLSNMIAGFTILIDRPFRTADRIKLATGETGDVLEIGIRSTRIRMLDHNLLVVPNAELTNTRIINFNLPTTLGTGSVEVRVAFGTDLARAEQILLDLMHRERAIVLEPKASVVVKRFTDNGVDLQMSFLVSEFTDAAGVENRLRRAVYQRFEEEKIVIPVTQHEVRLTDRR